MAPEYVLTGEYSEKSDVYSFGIMVLEIVSGQRNRRFHQSQENLLVHAWRLWNEDRSFELIESTLYHSCSRNEVIRCIQIGMLCVQSDAARRPTTGAMVLMLTGSVALPLPSTPVMFGYDTDIDVTRVELSELYQTSTMSATSYTHI
ncbi:cysteine-rich receptor-like protein kinase 10 [Beta vulgaris subsp. vulgaris]|uniref:cysteine-rich receptor-like protein kinase 10 n=1 Tax=Beta vulgaris subsp. vulgaris TaxID=3555 RepID=UPI002036F457|nr:cysteine-rich receptor-like protein kinase 10 [Beta vulgaris subsp. vulgaris]